MNLPFWGHGGLSSAYGQESGMLSGFEIACRYTAGFGNVSINIATIPDILYIIIYLITLAKFIHLSLILVAGQPLPDVEPGHIQMKVAILGGGVHIVPIPQGVFLLNIGSRLKWTIYIPPGANF